jgi:hypothetical protein
MNMDHDEFRANLRRALHLPDDASDYAILAEAETAYHFYVLNRPLPGDEGVVVRSLGHLNVPTEEEA